MLLVLVAIAVITRRQLGVQVGDQAWVLHTEQVRAQLVRVELLVKDAETGQRGFLYTGNPKYLDPYNEAVGEAGKGLDILAKLTADNPRQQQRVPVLRDLVRKKFGEMAETIALFRSGKADAAKSLVLSDEGLHYMRAIEAQVGEMEQEEDALQADRIATYHRSIRITVVCIYLASVIAAIGLFLLAYSILKEMNLRERYGREIAEREEWYRVTLFSLGDGVVATDEAGLVTFLNPLAEALTGWNLQEAKGRAIQDVFPIFNEYTLLQVENPVERVIELGGAVGLANHTVLRHISGTLTPIEDSAAPIRDDRDKLIGVVLVFRDASHERKAQEILRKTEKLAAAARLSATFAHEINNPLAAVVNLIYIVKGLDGMPAEAIQPLEMAEQELERVSHITRQTLGFYRESSIRGRVDLPTVIENVLKLYSNKLKAKNIEIVREFGECPPVEGLTGELTQAISNLVSNAADAVSVKGLIRVKLSSMRMADREWARMEIEDDGPGIPLGLLERIFEPFFTTKTDFGTGLGLWVTKEIVDRHEGSIQVVSPLSDGAPGTAFVVLLPRAK